MKDPRYEDRSPEDAGGDGAPAPERPVPDEERRREEGQPARPSQAEGERED